MIKMSPQKITQRLRDEERSEDAACRGWDAFSFFETLFFFFFSFFFWDTFSSSFFFSFLDTFSSSSFLRQFAFSCFFLFFRHFFFHYHMQYCVESDLVSQECCDIAWSDLVSQQYGETLHGLTKLIHYQAWGGGEKGRGDRGSCREGGWEVCPDNLNIWQSDILTFWQSKTSWQSEFNQDGAGVEGSSGDGAEEARGGEERGGSGAARREDCKNVKCYLYFCIFVFLYFCISVFLFLYLYLWKTGELSDRIARMRKVNFDCFVFVFINSSVPMSSERCCLSINTLSLTKEDFVPDATHFNQTPSWLISPHKWYQGSISRLEIWI